MSHPALYDEDILLWSEEQAAILRKLGRTRRGLPNEFDVENVAEEIESVGRSELASVESLIQRILVHLIRLFAEPQSEAVRHWRGEIFAFHSEMRRRYSASMRQRIDLDQLWRLAREQSLLTLDAPHPAESLPEISPFTLDDMLAERLDSFDMVRRLQLSVSPKEA